MKIESIDIFDHDDGIELDDFNGYEELFGQLKEYPNCCGYGIYVGVHTASIKGATKLFKEILEWNKIEEYGFGAVICTVTEKEHCNELEKNGWEKLTEFKNYGSGNTIYHYQFKL